MKSKITLLFISLSIGVFAQIPIPSYYGVNNSVYDVVTSTTPINHAPTGANAVWDFNQLAFSGQSLETFGTPTAAELLTYPGSTAVSNLAITMGATTNSTKIFSKNVASNISFTALKGTGLELNYATNNANLGVFPKNYGASTTDNTAGTFIYDTYNGTFTGVITTTVDAYGTLTLNNSGHGGFSGPVTRLKIVQNIDLIYGFFGNVGTVVQTTYAYFSAANGNIPEFRSTSIVANIPLLSINQTIVQDEDYFANLLSIDTIESNSKNFSIYPNPTNDILNIQTNNNQNISKLVLSDINGRVVLEQPKTNVLNINDLQKGVYFLKITTDHGDFIEKIIKK